MAERAAIVTGASSGIGLAVARMLADEGYGVTMAARRPEKLAGAVAELRDAGHDGTLLTEFVYERRYVFHKIIGGPASRIVTRLAVPAPIKGDTAIKATEVVELGQQELLSAEGPMGEQE